MTNRRYKDTERKLREVMDTIDEIAKDFAAEDKERDTDIYPYIHTHNDFAQLYYYDRKDNDAGDRELIRIYGRFFEKLGQKLQELA